MTIADIHNLFLKSTGISTDTRSLQKGNLFIALSGENFNGNKFAQQAEEKGAIAVIIDDINYQSPKSILVDDTLNTLQNLANFHRNQLNIPIIALTGSNGKTTTKELINAVLSKKYNTTATKGNLNNHIGVPLTLLSMDKSTEIGIVEMGANNFKEIETLARIAAPDYGYITNFGKAHLEGFGDINGVIKAKTELYEYLRNNKKTVFINADNDTQLEKAKEIKQYTFSEQKNTNCNISFTEANPNVIVNYNTTTIKSNLIGSYNFSNIAAAISIGTHFNVNSSAIKEAIENYTPTNNRSQILIKESNKIILDAYNANPTSMMAALENFNKLSAKNKVLFIGDMFELGKEAQEEHQKIVDYITQSKISDCYILGENFKKTTHSKNIQSYNNFEALKAVFKENIKNSTILIKGSRGMALERILDIL